MYDDLKYLEEVEQALASGRIEKDFKYGSQAKKEEILDFLQRLMDLADAADEVATRIIFKDSYLGVLAGVNTQNDREPSDEE